MFGWLVGSYFIDDILWTVRSVTLFTLGGTLYLKKGVETSLMMISWEVGEEEELYTILVLGLGMMLFL